MNKIEVLAQYHLLRIRANCLTTAIVAIICFSCGSLVQDVNPNKIPNSETKLVVHGFLSPLDTMLTVRLDYSNPVLGTNVNSINATTSINDADVKLSDGSKTVALKNFDGHEYRISAKSMPITVNKTYTLDVKTKNGEVITASCTIPKLVAIKEVKRDSVKRRTNSTDYVKTVKLFWQDPVGTGNYYRVQGATFTEVQNFDANNKLLSKSSSVSTISFRETRRNSELTDDSSNDGGLLASLQGRLNQLYYSNDPKTKYTERIEVALISCDKSYYDYHKSLEGYTGENPFSEPNLVATNIKGGLGCFGGFNYVKMVVK